jgi:CheY-specific phosphatase CheX
MKKTLMTAMTTSISEVMETMFFLPVEIGSEMLFEKSGIEKERSIACQLTFTGDASGKLTIAAPSDLAAEMAENFIGEPKDQLTQEHLSGTLTEMLNMVCGNALSKTKPKVPYALGIPETVSWGDLDEKTEYTLIETLDSRMVVSLMIDEG